MEELVIPSQDGLPPSQVLTADANLHVCNLVAQGVSLKDAREKVFGVKAPVMQSASQKADELL